jgi:hypothetical protein
VSESKNAALFVEVSLLLTAVFLGTNMVAVKYAVTLFHRCSSSPYGLPWGVCCCGDFCER